MWLIVSRAAWSAEWAWAACVSRGVDAQRRQAVLGPPLVGEVDDLLQHARPVRARVPAPGRTAAARTARRSIVRPSTPVTL